MEGPPDYKTATNIYLLLFRRMYVYGNIRAAGSKQGCVVRYSKAGQGEINERGLI